MKLGQYVGQLNDANTATMPDFNNPSPSHCNDEFTLYKKIN